jgi:hypothetical protein
MGRKYGNVKRGKALDLSDGNTYCSGWERDIARFLNHLQSQSVIEGWEYEPQTFSFQSLGYKRGPFTYKPDYAVRYKKTIRKDRLKILNAIFDEVHPGRTVFWEVKGQETGNDRSKWRRFKKHTDYPLEIIKRDKLVIIQELFSAVIPYWESRVYG